MVDARKLNGCEAVPDHLRLGPEMVSLRLLVLAPHGLLRRPRAVSVSCARGGR